MAICTTCEKEIHDEAFVCPHCGCLTGKDIILWGILGYVVPVAGLILFILWNKTWPKRAKSAGIGALISTVVSTVIPFVIFAIYIAFYVFIMIIALTMA